ncbi:MAG: hypothetical protein M3R59_09940 [Verrucomicrobiota bacterium]|nr:hypothetical protein [Verrucomicrobiota bacterium]
MNRFDPSFNDTDPITQRPFSGGHPDGVWIIAICLGVPIVVAALGVIVCVALLFFTPLRQALLSLLGAVAATVLISLIFIPPIALLFRRSRHALTWLLCLLGLFVTVFGAGVTAPAQNPARSALESAGAMGCLLFGAFAWYLYRLRRQELLR